MRSRFSTSFILMLLVLAGALIFSLYYLYDAFMGSSAEDASINTLLGIVGLGVTVYLATQLLRRPYSRKAPPKILTTIECGKCGLKSVRAFADGDYVFKTSEKCQKCDEPMLITAIYTEEEKK